MISIAKARKETRFMRSRVSQLCAASVSLVVFGVLITTLPGSRALTNRRHNQAAPVSFNLPGRHYLEGEKLTYRMKATNRARLTTTSYEAQADGMVKKDSAGQFVEEYAWSNLIRDNAAVSLSPAAASLRQILSLEPDYRLSVPDLSQVIPLVGPYELANPLCRYAGCSSKPASSCWRSFLLQAWHPRFVGRWKLCADRRRLG